MASSELVSMVKAFDDGEPRIRDSDLGRALGYAEPRMIRKLIQAHREQLDEFGVCYTVEQTSGPAGGRPAQEYWLTEKQAYLLCTYAETQKADEVRFTLVNVFLAYKRGIMIVAEPTVELSVLDVQKRQIVNLVQPLLQQALLPFERKIEVVEKKIDTGFNAVLAKLGTVDEKVTIVADDCKRRRRGVKFEDRCKIIDCLRTRRHGICPACHVLAILTADGDPNDDFEIDHFFGRHQAELKQVWPVCRACNIRLEDTTFRQERHSEFIAWQHLLAIHLEPPLLRGLPAIGE